MKNEIVKQRKSITPFWLASWCYFLKIKFGGGVTDARGSIAGNTFSRNHFGAYSRARVTPVNPNTARQVLVRTAIAFLSDRWANTLTLAQRTAWDLYGSSVAMVDSLGATIFLTGYNHYIRSNLTRKIGPTVVVDAGPTIFEVPGQDPTFAITVSEATQNITATFDNTLPWAVEDGAFMFLSMGKPQNAQRVKFFGPWRYYRYVGGVDPGGAVTPDVQPCPFAVAEGQHIWAYARICRADGRLSQAFNADVFCAA